LNRIKKKQLNLKKRKTRIRGRVYGTEQVPRLVVFRSLKHIYAQVIEPNGSGVVAAASTLQSDIKAGVKYTGNSDAAMVVGKMIAERAKAAGVTKVAFDRSGFRYHGRVKALADAARESGLEF